MMTIRDKIFDSLADAKELAQMSEAVAETEVPGKNIFANADPFEFYRKTIDSNTYKPVTQRGLRKAFTRGLTGIEFFIEMATSLRPLADEAQDIDEITRLLSQQKLTLNPNLHSVTILRNLIKDPNPEIALYAAEGLNTIENTFIEKIQRAKEKIKKIENLDSSELKNKKRYILYYIAGLLYLEFAKLLQGQQLIQRFYLNEALSYLKAADEEKKNNRRILRTIGDVYILLGKYQTAIRIFTFLFSKDNKDRNYLLKLAECYYNIGDYQNVVTLASLASKTEMELDEMSSLIIYQWLLNI